MIQLSNGGIYLVHGKNLIPENEVKKVESILGRKVDKEEAHKGTIAYRILEKHNQSSDMKHLKIKFDALTSHDITYVGIIQTAKASGMDKFPMPYILTCCHNSLCAVGGTINEDDHMFGLSAAKKYGGIYVPPHVAVIHQYMREMYAGCGKKVDKGAAGEGGAKKVVNVAFTNYYVPYDFVNDKGEPDGFEVAVMQAVAKKLPQYEWKFTPTSDDDLLIGVESGKYTIGTKGIWKTPAREKKYIFPKNNIGASVIGLVIRKDEAATIKSIDDLAKTQGKLAPIAPQDARYNVIASYNTAHPDQKINLVSSENFHNSDAYTWVMEGRYDAYLEVELSYQNNIAKENAPYHRFADQLVYLRYKGIPTYALVNKKEVKLCEEVDKAIEELRKDGTIDKLEQKYFGESLQKYLNQK